MSCHPAFWVLAQKFGGQFINFAVTLIVARLLEPANFGIIGLATVWIALVGVFSENGFGAALIQRKQPVEGQFSSVFFLNLVVGIILFIISAALAPLVASYWNAPLLSGIIPVLSISYILNALSTTHVVWATRQLQFRQLAIRDLVSNCVSGVVAAGLALMGFGVWSLVAQIVLASTVGCLMMWNLIPWRPNPREVKIEHLVDLWSYGGKLFAQSLCKYFVVNTDRLIIGYYLGTELLGYYTMAYKIVVVPVTTFRFAMGTYLFPRFSALQDQREDVMRVFIFSIKLQALAVGLFGAVLCSAAQSIVPIMLGAKWISTVPVIYFLFAVSFIQTLYSPMGELMKALNRPELLMRWTAFFSIIMLTSLYVGVHQGFHAALWSLVIANAASLLIAILFSQCVLRLALVHLIQIAKVVIPTILAAVLVMQSIGSEGEKAAIVIFRTVIMGGVGLLVSALVVYAVDKCFAHQLANLLPKHQFMFIKRLLGDSPK